MANGVAGGSVLTGVHRVFQAGERLLFDQAELVRLESREQFSAVAVRFGIAAAGFVFLFTAWLGLLATAIVAVDGVPLAWRIGGAAVAQLLIARGRTAVERGRERCNMRRTGNESLATSRKTGPSCDARSAIWGSRCCSG